MPPVCILMVALAGIIAGCTSDTSTGRTGREITVGATRGLTSFKLTASPSGSSAHAAYLIYDEVKAHVDSATRDGQIVRMHKRPDSSLPISKLAQTFRFEGLLATAVENSEIVATFSEEESAARVATLTHGGFALGPFTLQSFDNGTATLVRKSAHPIERLVIREVSASDEWRHFLGGTLSVIPLVSLSYLHHLGTVPSVKIVDYPVEHSMGLLFNTRKPPFADVQMRHYLASLLDRKAISRVLYGDESQAQQMTAQEGLQLSSSAISSPLLLPFLVTDSDTARTASIIRFQLAEHGVEVELIPLEMKELVQLCSEGRFDLTLLPIPTGRRGNDRFLSSEHPEAGNITGYANPEFDKAFDQNRVAAMKKILERDLPVTLLFKEQFFAAIRSDLCLDGQPDPKSWRWISDLYPCDEKTLQ